MVHLQNMNQLGHYVADRQGKFTDATYLMYDPFAGDRDVKIICKTVAMVTTRKPHPCAAPCDGVGATQHIIPAGVKARYEHALVDDEWGSYYVCLDCMDRWLVEYCELTPDYKMEKETVI